MGVVAVFIVPVGVATAIYLEEYADPNRWWNRLIELNIQNLAAVPSIVYGILGLAFLVRGPLHLGNVILAGGLTLGLLVLPMVIIAGREALRAVPPSIREGSMALGATQWQTIWRQVLPAAIPGVATGVILALSRAIGETAPLIVVGAATVIAFNPTGLDSSIHGNANPDLRLDLARIQRHQRLPAARGSGDPPPADPAARHEQHRDLATKPLRTEVVGDLELADQVTEQPEIRVDLPHPTATAERPKPSDRPSRPIFQLDGLGVAYGDKPAVRDVSFNIGQNDITALIGPSGCGKSTVIRCLNRMNDLIPTASVEGKVLYHDQDLYGPEVDAVEVRKRIGMVFQKPNPFPKSIFDNIAFGPRVLGMKGSMDEIVERALHQAALWDEVKDRLKTNAFGMSGGQQQRLCIARALAVEPDVVLMDEPCSALDPISTGKIEDLMMDLKQKYSIVIVTHNMQQAARVSDKTAFFTVELDESGKQRTGRVVEFDDTEKIFTNPSDSRTEAYVTGKVG